MILGAITKNCAQVLNLLHRAYESKPRQKPDQDFGFASSGCHLDYKSRQVFIKHAGRHSTGTVKSHKIILVFYPDDIIEINDGLQGLPAGQNSIEIRRSCPSA